jgi:hypothetical protein
MCRAIDAAYKVDEAKSIRTPCDRVGTGVKRTRATASPGRHGMTTAQDGPRGTSWHRTSRSRLATGRAA